MARNVPFETLSRRQVAAIRRDSQEPFTLVGYEDTEGTPRGLIGDEIAPYVHMVGRAALDGGADAPEDIPTVGQGQAQRVLVDEYGRIWANVNVSPAEVQNVQGNIASGAADAGSFPVKVGGIAVASASGLAVAVDVDDRVDAAYDANGRQIVVTVPSNTTAQQIEGNVLNDDPDSTSRPVKVGGRAVANGAVGAAVAAADRVNAAYSLNGAAHVLTSPHPITDATSYAYAVQAATVGDATGRLVLKASPGRVRRILVANNDTVERFAQIHNAAIVGNIATGTMLTPGLPIPAGGFGFFDFSEADLACSTGIAVALSTTQVTYTAVAVTGQFSGQFA